MIRPRSVAALTLAAVAVAATDYWWVRGMQHWLGVHTGDVNEPGPFYGFWSGFGSVIIPPILQGLTIAAVFAWHHNCHHKRCWRFGKHQVDGSPWCNHHHGDARQRAADAQQVTDPVLIYLGGKFDRLADSVADLAEAIRLSLNPATTQEGNQP